MKAAGKRTSAKRREAAARQPDLFAAFDPPDSPDPAEAPGSPESPESFALESFDLGKDKACAASAGKDALDLRGMPQVLSLTSTDAFELTPDGEKATGSADPRQGAHGREFLELAQGALCARCKLQDGGGLAWDFDLHGSRLDAPLPQRNLRDAACARAARADAL